MSRAGEQARATEAMMAVSQTMMAVVARTLTEISAEVTVPQLRVLVLLSSRGPMNLRTVAEHLDVNPSNASRTCDQLVASNKVVRQQDQEDGRNVHLSLSRIGEKFVDDLMHSRRRLIDRVVARMDPADHPALADALEAFSAAVAAAPPEETVGLANGRIIPWLL
jgi:DNA-binding MarR family transcriptional regulator